MVNFFGGGSIRNFVIISHIDHGKSTLADRFLELTGTVERRKMRAQYLDQMDLERERGITIKMQPVRMIYRPHGSLNENERRDEIVQGKTASPFSSSGAIHQAGQFCVLNLIDTPGHADFSYEVSRALAAVEGAILLVDASQGVQAQTIANLHLAQEQKLAIIPVINKIDLALARVEETEDEIIKLIGCEREEIFKISAKTGEGIPEVLEAVVRIIPSPSAVYESHIAAVAEEEMTARALIFDSHFDSFSGVVAHIRVFEGAFRKRERIAILAAKRDAEILEVGHFSPAPVRDEDISAGEIGYIATGIKEADAVRAGDTIAGERFKSLKVSAVEPLPGYRKPQPVVFAGVYPESSDDYAKLLDALKKIKLTDAAIVFEPESSEVLGRGCRVGFLGLLHMEIVGERLKREYGLAPVFTAPSVVYRITRQDGKTEYIYSAAEMPDLGGVKRVDEPWARLEVVAPGRFIGAVMSLLSQMKGVHSHKNYLGLDRLIISYEVPLKDILVDFADNLKSVTSGYASFSYELADYRPGDLDRLDILIAGEREPALTQIVRRDLAYREGRVAAEKLKEIIPRQLFPVSIQSAVGGRIIARETLPALKKDVTGYLYGGDRTRKMKLWKKQKEGKKRLKEIGDFEIPHEGFLKVIKA